MLANRTARRAEFLFKPSEGLVALKEFSSAPCRGPAACAPVRPDQQMRPAFVAFKGLRSTPDASAGLSYSSFVAQIFCRSAFEGGTIIAGNELDANLPGWSA
jgi:hypothetical protein